MRRLAMTVGVCLVLGGTDAGAQGIPVFDAQGVFQAIQQLQQAQQQFQQMKQTHDSFNKITSMANVASLLKSPAVRRALPDGFAAAEAALLGKGAGADRFLNQDGIYSPAGAAYQAEVDKTRGQIAGQKSVGQGMYDAASIRIKELDKLMSELQRSEDPKTTLDLQARVQIEIAAANTDVLRMQALAMLAGAQEREETARRAGQFDRLVDKQSH